LIFRRPKERSLAIEARPPVVIEGPAAAAAHATRTAVSGRKMHEGEVDLDEGIVRRLLASQFPRLAHLPLERFESGGTVNAIYRLGDELYVRLPLTEKWTWQLDVERKWIPRLAPHVPVPIPEAVGFGEPSDEYPFRWAVYRWLPGEPWQPHRVTDERAAALDLARVIGAIHALDTTGGDTPKFEMPLRTQDGWIRQSIEGCRDLIDGDALLALWEDALRLPDFEGPACWVHADLGSGNVLTAGNRVSALIDWGATHVGDPALDLKVAWTMLTAGARRHFREAFHADEATWLRARGWAIKAVGLIPYYRHTNRFMFDEGMRTVNEILAEL
jgi:aminoglycoside phosphotransferase (APT) family kinase protein